MRTSTTVQDTAILDTFRDVEMVMTINGSSTQWPVTEFQTDAQMKDTPSEVSLLGGVAARQVKFKLDHTFAAAVSPYQKSIIPAPYPLPIGSTIKITINFWPSLSRMGSPTYSGSIFTGYVVTIDGLDAISDISITAQDESYNLGSNLSLPAAGSVGQSPIDTTVDTDFSTLLVVDLALRACNRYLTAPPVLSGTDWAKYTVLSVPGYGGNVPDIGLMTTAAYQTKALRTTGRFAPDVIMVDQANYRTVKVIRNAQDFALLRLDCWVKGAGNLVTIPGGRLAMSATTGQLQFYANTAGAPTAANTSGPDCRVGWHHALVEITCALGGAMTIKIAADGVANTFVGTWSDAPLGGVGSAGTLDGDFVTVGNAPGTAPVGVELLELIFVPNGTAYVNPPSRFNAVPGLASFVTPTMARLQAIAPQTGLNAWQTIQSVAAAEGALCWFDEDGAFVFEPQKTWLNRRQSAPVRTFDSSMHSNVAMSISADGVRKRITANYTPVSCVYSNSAVPAYVADSVLNFRTGLTTTQIQTDQRFFAPSFAASGANNTVGQSWFTAVRATSVNDPAAVILDNVAVSIVPTSTGFNLVVLNPNSFTVSFWNPTDGVIPVGPMLIIHGTRIVTGDPIQIVQNGNPSAKDDLALDDNPWRQRRRITRELCHSAAQDTYNPIPVVQNVDVPGDPRIQLGDVVALQASTIGTPGGLPVVVVDIAHNFSTSSDYRMTLGVKPLGPPTGWLLGVPGRSELGSTTYLPLGGPEKAIIPIPVSDMPTTSLPGWDYSYGQDFTVDVAEGGFASNSRSALLPSGGAGYAAYYSTLNMYPDNQFDTSHNARYWPSKTMSVASSVLRIRQRTEVINGVSQPIGGQIHPVLPGQKPDGGAFRGGPYGRWAIKMRHTSNVGTGLCGFGCVIDLIDTTTGQTAGEITWAEGDNNSPNIEGYMHYMDPGQPLPSGQQQTKYGPMAGLDRRQWHIYVIDWRPNRLEVFCDGISGGVRTDRVPAGKMALSIQAGSSGFAPAIGTTALVEIDWIAAWTYNSATL